MEEILLPVCGTARLYLCSLHVIAAFKIDCCVCVLESKLFAAMHFLKHPCTNISYEASRTTAQLLSIGIQRPTAVVRSVPGALLYTRIGREPCGVPNSGTLDASNPTAGLTKRFFGEEPMSSVSRRVEVHHQRALAKAKKLACFAVKGFSEN